jgi:Kef-type K+ transport system membrane component KefB
VLAFLSAAGLLDPHRGLGLVSRETDIRTVSESGFSIVLFMIGLEINVKKRNEAGRSLVLSGIAQLLLCTACGIGFFRWLGYRLGHGTYDALYLAILCAPARRAPPCHSSLEILLWRRLPARRG